MLCWLLADCSIVKDKLDAGRFIVSLDNWFKLYVWGYFVCSSHNNTWHKRVRSHVSKELQVCACWAGTFSVATAKAYYVALDHLAVNPCLFRVAFELILFCSSLLFPCQDCPIVYALPNQLRLFICSGLRRIYCHLYIILHLCIDLFRCEVFCRYQTNLPTETFHRNIVLRMSQCCNLLVALIKSLIYRLVISIR